MRLTIKGRSGRTRKIRSPLAKFLLLSLLWFPLMLICFVIHVPIYLVNGRGFWDASTRSLNPPAWASMTALVVYATILVLAVVAIT